MIDSRSGTTLRSIVPWLAATGLLVFCEVQLLSHRSWSAAVPNGTATTASLQPELKHHESTVATERLSFGEALPRHRSAIVVVGCVNAESEGEFEVALTIEPSFAGRITDISAKKGSPEKSRVEIETINELASPDITSQPRIATASVIQPRRPPIEPTTRSFFINSPRGASDDVTSHAVLNCRMMGESNLIRVYIEQSMVERPGLDSQVAELLHLSDEVIGPRITKLVGPVCDCDADGKLAVVLSNQLDQPGGWWAGVEGLTRASDFRREMPRPFGNQADVIFLSTRLQPGERLRAILAHEWAHAAIFSRRYGTVGADSEPAPTEDDWLNEGLTHLIEVQAGGTSSNVEHRTRAFLARPEAAPLLVRDYARPQFWRHHGCRGAAFSFLSWCQNRSGPQFVERLIAGRDVGVEHLERAAGLSFEQLFREWTTSMGRTLADREVTRRKDDSQMEQVAQHVQMQCPTFHEWHSADGQPRRAMTLQLRETTAAYVKIRLADSEIGASLVATSPTGCRLQLTVIPIESAEDAPAPTLVDATLK